MGDGPRSLGDRDQETMLSAARVFAAITAESLAQSEEVTLPQLRVLVLASLGGAVTPTEVAAALDIHLSSASRICDRLVGAGHLQRRTSEEDRRQVELRLTPAGEDLVSRVTANRSQVFARLLDRLDARSRQQLVAGLTALVEVAEEYDQRRSLLP